MSSQSIPITMESKQRAAVIAILFAVVTLYFISQYYLTTKEDEVKTSQSIQLRSNFYYNNDLVVKSSLYESCSSLRSMLEHVEKEELHNAERTKHYQKLYDDKKLGCGKHRTAPGLISKSIIVGYDECPQEIIPAKRRLYDLMNELCKTQVEANAFCPPLTYGLSQVHVPPPVNRSHHSPLFGGFDADHKCLAKTNSVHKDRTSKLFRGILYTGKIKHFKDIYQSIYALRKTGNTLPVEVWVNGFGMYFCKNIFMNPKNNALSGVTCMEFSNDIISFAAKFYALLFTEFEEILYIDADNIPVRDVNELFESEGYQKTGAVIWPDMWSSKCAVDDTELQMSGLSCQENFVLFSAEFSKELQYGDTRNYLQESEAGQMVLNLQKHRGLINLGRRLYEDNQFFRKIFNGDKDIFRFIFLLTGTPFHYISEVPGYSVAPDDTRDCLIHFHHNARVPSSQKLPIFFHQLKARNAQAFAKFVRPLPEERDAPAVCVRVKEDGLPSELPLDHPLQKKYYKKGEASVILVEGEAHQPQGKAYLVETPPEAAALVTFAQDVFKTPGRTERTCYDTHWVLPSNRYDHIVNNPTTVIAQNHVNKNMIPPVWTKVSRTPWEKPANLCGGFGRKMQNTSVSTDAPVFFLNPDRMIEKFYANHPEAKPEVINKRSALFKKTESAHVLPGGMNLLAYTEQRPKTAGPRTRMVPYGKQTYKMEIPPPKVYKESRLPPVPTQRSSSARTTSRSEFSAL